MPKARPSSATRWPSTPSPIGRDADTSRVRAKDPDAPVVLEVKSLAKSFHFKTGLFGQREFRAVRDVNFKLKRGHTLGVVGESGSGKTTMA
ncbi:ATP-binding cassette domain-containing protein, partial [Ideonella sp. B508-1]|uniref:ATP-binding cassette domain-containing protein n=1 Tax=Ideonella sp. B508-1 TaxID=137716 RepID=UPI0035B53B93